MSETTKSTHTLAITGAGCASCVAKIEGALNALDTVDVASMNFAERRVSVTGSAPPDTLVKAIEAIGYGATESKAESLEAELAEQSLAEEAQYKAHLQRTALALGLGVPLMLYGWLGGSMMIASSQDQWLWGVIGLVVLAAMIYSGSHFYVGGYRALLRANPNMDTLIALGTGAAWLYSAVVVVAPSVFPEMARHIYFEASVMIVGLVSLGQALEVRARGRSSDAIRRLIGLQAKTARVIRDGNELDVALEHIKVGDILRVRTGEKFAVDGVLIDGAATVDESMLTGEPMPVTKESGEGVSAGTLNIQGSCRYRAERVGKDTALAHIIQAVKSAQMAKPPIGRLADRISLYFVPTVVVIALVSALIWWLVGPAPQLPYALIAATSVLIIACPCALGLATPMSVTVGMGKAAEYGVLIRNGEALELSASLTTVVLDKTGTLTEGKPKVSSIVSADQTSQDSMIRLAAALEVGAHHPLASAILAEADARGLQIPESQAFETLPGLGVKASVEGAEVLLGNRRLMSDSGVAGLDELERLNPDKNVAETHVFLSKNGGCVGVIGVLDPIKVDSAEAIERFKQEGLRTVMLTGDDAETAQWVASQLGIDEVHAEVMPEQKLAWIETYKAQGDVVAMVGDGINDAPALAAAHVGFAIGTGTDIAVQSADVALMRGSLHGVADAIEISRATLGNIRQNLLGAFIYNVAGIPIAAGAFYPLLGWMLSPVVAGAAMAMSSVTVVSNANRLRLFKIRRA